MSNNYPSKELEQFAGYIFKDKDTKIQQQAEQIRQCKDIDYINGLVTEIKQLQAELTEYKAAHAPLACISAETHNAIVSKLQAENQRLKEEDKFTRKSVDDGVNLFYNHEREIVRLKAALKEIRKRTVNCGLTVLKDIFDIAKHALTAQPQKGDSDE